MFNCPWCGANKTVSEVYEEIANMLCNDFVEK